MAPFIPYGLVSQELFLFYALVLGIAFGYVLEQAGFSSSRKLAGVFYGYDFVVLKVFFTAGITAMTGMLLLNYLGWIDMGLVYINPTFLWSAIVGGVIMGFGFIMGGFCPGTSIVGAVIGKVDAMVFILGLFIGVFIFGHFYNAFEPLYTGSFMGNLLVYEVFGLSAPVFALLLTFIALIAFTLTQMIEDRINRVSGELIGQRPSYRLPSMLLLLMLVALVFLPPKKPGRTGEPKPGTLLQELGSGTAFVSAEKVLHYIMNENDKAVLIDTRDPSEYARFTLPLAVNIRPETVTERRWRGFFKNDRREKVFFGNGNPAATRAWMLARRAGYKNIVILDGGLNELFELLYFRDAEPTAEAARMEEVFHARFVEQARDYFKQGMRGQKKPATTAPVMPDYERPAAVVGGC